MSNAIDNILYDLLHAQIILHLKAAKYGKYFWYHSFFLV